jgi:serine/threonine protein kinase
MSEHNEANPTADDGVPMIRMQVEIPGYEILGKAGEGAMGVVWRAKQHSLDREVAIKILRGEFASNPDEVADFLREARAVAALKHPGLVPAYDVGEHDGIVYFVMEFVHGQTLGDKLRRDGKLGQKQALTIARELADALLYARDSASIIHRDIKPDNIIIEPDGTARLTDLGLASIVGDKQTPAAGGEVELAGTPNYMAPEQAQGAHDIDFHADMYALGATLYHMVTGQLPFEDLSANDTLTAQITKTIPNPRSLNPAVTPGCAGLIRRLMMKHPADRYASWKACVQDLRKAEEAKLVTVRGKGNSTIGPPPPTAKGGTAAAAKRAGQANAAHKPINTTARLCLKLALLGWWGWMGYQLLDLPPKPQLQRRTGAVPAPTPTRNTGATAPPVIGEPTPAPTPLPDAAPTSYHPPVVEPTRPTQPELIPASGLSAGEINALGANIIQQILAQDPAAASQQLTAASSRAAPGQLDALKQLVRTASNVDKAALGAFRAAIGKTNTLQQNGRRLTIVVKSVRGQQIAADMIVSAGNPPQKRRIEFGLSQIDPKEQSRWLAASASPDAAVTRCLLLMRSGDYMAAQEQAKACGAAGEVLTAGIDERIRLITE